MKLLQSYHRYPRCLQFVRLGGIVCIGLIHCSFLPGDTTVSKHNRHPVATANNVQFKSLLPSSPIAQTSVSAYATPVAINPQVQLFKEAYVHRENHEMDRMKAWGKPYFAIYDQVLSKHKLPVELKYLSVIESSLISTLRSHAGAIGPWQLMYDEAIRFGLKVRDGLDERTDYYKSTDAAARLLKELYAKYGDWLLVIAAYNAGPGAVHRAMKKSGSTDFWKLQYFLPEETRNHVKKYISTHYYFEGNGGITTMTKQEAAHYHHLYVKKTTLTAAQLKSSATTRIRGYYNKAIICAAIGYPVADFDVYNPNFDNELSSGSDYELRLPEKMMSNFNLQKQGILEKCFQKMLD